ncbi:hypothetical protein [Armatimonas sp.]|uniref:hypothetical protein n=1 Tax=Armatimonas sp. TaxID=1872638 RepID=UPI00286CCD41|nr:hypothetical protein [Armatimonas sp.]
MKLSSPQAKRLITAGGLLLASVGLTVAPGCSGATSALSVFASRSFISEAITQPGGASSTLSITTNAYQNATGVFSVSRAALKKSRVVWPLTIPLVGITLSGTFDPDTGEVNLNGIYTDPATRLAYEIRVTGILPADNSQGTLHITANGIAQPDLPFRRSDSPVVLPSPGTTPTPAPTPAPTPTPVPTPSPTPVPTNGTLTVTNRTGDFPSGPLALGKLGGQRGGDTYINFTMGQGSYSTYPNTLIEFNLIDSSTPSAPFRAGDIFNNLGTSATNYPVRLSISRQLGRDSSLYFKPTSGTLRITAMTSTSITVSLENVVVVANGAYPTSTPNSGGATLNGTLTANF